MNTQIIMLVQGLDGGAAMALAILVTATFERSAVSAPRNQNQRLVIGMAIAIAAWFGISSGMAAAGDFSAANGAFALPLLALSLLVPLAIGVAVILLVAPIRQLVSQRARSTDRDRGPLASGRRRLRLPFNGGPGCVAGHLCHPCRSG